MREDAIGMFWQTLAKEKPTKISTKVPRALPPTPDTGWRPPTSFPRLDAARRIVVDVETKDVELEAKGPGVRRGAQIIGLGIGTGDAQWYFPIRHEVGAEHNLDPAAVLKWAKDALAGPQDKVGASLLYDADFLAHEGIELGGRWLDVQIAEPLLDENRFTYSLDALGKEYLGEGKVRGALEEWCELAYRDKNYRQNLWRTSPVLVGPYAEWDVNAPLRILERQESALSEQGLSELFGIETDLLPMLLAMRRFGVRIDPVRRQALDDELTVAIQAAQGALDAHAGFKVNVNAGRDLARLFDKLGLAYPRTTSNNPSFTKAWLEHYDHPIGKAIIDVRKLVKMQSTFVRGYMSLAVNDRIHTVFHPLRTDENGAVSGRFASSDPNLQNIPIRDEYWGPRVRAMFVPEEGHTWVRHDWSQIEYRFLAHFGIGANAREVRRLYREDPKTDFHEMVVKLTGLGRKAAKNVNFGLVYGMGVDLLAETLGMSRAEAEETVFAVYHERVPFVKETYNYAANRAATRGYVRTILGRRARFDWYQPRDWNATLDPEQGGKGYDEDGSSAELGVARARARWGDKIKLKRAFTHKALNRCLQGSAADLMKKAMRDIWRSGVYRVIPVAHLTVHDELDHSMPPTREGERAVREIKRIMETALELRVPIVADEDRGASWGECS